MMPEARFQRSFVDSLLHYDWHPIEIPDDAKKTYSFGQRIAAAAHPYDLGGLDRKGNYTAFELKAESALVWNFSKLEYSERCGLQAVMERKRPALVLIQFKLRMGPLQKKRLVTEEDWLDEAWILPYKQLLKLEHEAFKGFDLVINREAGHNLPRGEDGLWKIPDLENYLRNKSVWL